VRGEGFSLPSHDGAERAQLTVPCCLLPFGASIGKVQEAEIGMERYRIGTLDEFFEASREILRTGKRRVPKRWYASEAIRQAAEAKASGRGPTTKGRTSWRTC
jgi:hypothetical protein